MALLQYWGALKKEGFHAERRYQDQGVKLGDL